MKGTYLLFDIGATHTRLGVSKTGKKVDGMIVFATPKNFNDGITSIKKHALLLCGQKIASSAGGIAGPLNQEKTKVINAPNLPGWNGKELVSELKKITRGRVVLENDNTIVGLGEAIYGAAKNYSIVVYYTFSTGVNGIRVVNGKVEPSAFGVEAGHQLIATDKTLFDLASGAALKRKYKNSLHEIKDRRIWDGVEKSIALGLYNSILHWSPEVVVLGGGLMKSVSLSNVKRHLKKQMKIFKQLPEIKKAALGDLNGLYGALELLKQK